MTMSLKQLKQCKRKDHIIGIRVDPEIKRIYDVARDNRWNLNEIFRDYITNYLLDNQPLLTETGKEMGSSAIETPTV